MLEKLLELLLNAKSGAIAGIFLIGTTGALVTATVQNGVTTITVTTPSASPSASASPSGSPTASPTASPTTSATASPTASPSSSSSSASANTCEQQARAMAAAVQEVDRAFSQYHSGLERLRERARTNALRTDLSNADKLLKQLRQSAVQQIHATSTCAKNDDEDKDNEDKDNEDEDSGEHTASPSAPASPTVAPSPTPSATAAPSSSPLVSGSDPKTIADNAVAAMKLVFSTVSAEFPTPTASTHPSHTEGHDGHGESGEHD